VDRYSPYWTTPEAYGLANVHANIAYRHVYPYDQEDLDRLAYYFDYEYADGRRPLEYTATLKEEIELWQGQRGAARLELTDLGDRLEIHDTRGAARRPMTILEGAARLAYLALDAGETAPNLRMQLESTLGFGVPDLSVLQGWLDEWRRDRLVLQEGVRYLSLAVNPAERVQLPVDRFLAQLATGAA
jgi:hypothetical protein